VNDLRFKHSLNLYINSLLYIVTTVSKWRISKIEDTPLQNSFVWSYMTNNIKRTLHSLLNNSNNLYKAFYSKIPSFTFKNNPNNPNSMLCHFPWSNQRPMDFCHFITCSKNMISYWKSCYFLWQNTQSHCYHAIFSEHARWKSYREYSKMCFAPQPEFHKFHTVATIYINSLANYGDYQWPLQTSCLTPRLLLIVGYFFVGTIIFSMFWKR